MSEAQSYVSFINAILVGLNKAGAWEGGLFCFIAHQISRGIIIILVPSPNQGLVLSVAGLNISLLQCLYPPYYLANTASARKSNLTDMLGEVGKEAIITL